MKAYFKNVLYSIFAGLMLTACESEPDYKTVRQEVIDQHDEVMMGAERAMKYKMKLDTLAISGLANLKHRQPSIDTAVAHQQITALTQKLNQADDKMSTWMNNFTTDVEGKSNAEAVKYFNEEKIKVKQLYSTYESVLRDVEAYLEKLSVKPDTLSKAMDHKHM